MEQLILNKKIMKIYIKFSILAIGLVFGFSACDKHFEELNTNPNEPSSTSTSFLLTNAQKSMMDYTWDEWFNGRRGNQLAQYWSSNQYTNESRYQLRISITNSYWAGFYSRSLQDLQEIINLNTSSPGDYVGFGKTENQIAVAKILQTWVYQNMTDCWGPIPFNQALQGAAFPNPAYDALEDVYAGMLSSLNSAIAALDVSDNSFQGDVIYNGDMSLWLKFANSLKLRIAIRMSDVESATASAAINEAVTSGVFTSNADNALFNYLGAAPNNNPLNEDYITRNDFCASNTMVDELDRLGDPRMSFFYAPAANTSTFVGEVYGLDEANGALTTDGDVSQRSAQILAASAPGVYMDYAQVEFIMAEAVERGYIGGSAADHYNNGVTASMQFWDESGTLTTTDINNYLSQPVVDYATAKAADGDWKVTIGRQKWIALYMQGIQGWSEWRRLDFGILQLPIDGTLDGTGIPTRMRYPLDEQTLNNSSYSEGVGLLGGADDQDTKLWWDVN